MDVKARVSKRAMELLTDVVMGWKLSFADGGPMVKALEAEFEKLHGVPGFAVANCTVGMEMVFRALGVQGKKVLVPANGMAADPLAVMNAGGIPVFGDVDKIDGTLLPSEIAKAAERHKDLAAVLYVHIGRAGMNYVDVVQACVEVGLPLVEDCAHVMGNPWAGKKGVAAVYSMFATKVLPAGEGGIVAGKPWLLETVRKMRLCGRESEWAPASVQGTNGKMSELNAAFGVAVLEHAKEIIERRLKACWAYDSCSLTGAYSIPGYKYMLNVVSKEKYTALVSANVISGKVFAQPLPLQPAFEHCEILDDISGAKEFCQNHVCLKTDVDEGEAKEIGRVASQIVRG